MELLKRWRIRRQIGFLGSDDPHVRHRACLALRTVGVAAVEPLMDALRSRPERVKALAASLLGHLGDRRAVGPLTSVLHSWQPSVRVNAARALGVLRDPQASDALIARLQTDREDSVKAECAKALGRLMDCRAVPPLIAALRRGSPEVGALVVCRLGRADAKRTRARRLAPVALACC